MIELLTLISTNKKLMACLSKANHSLLELVKTDLKFDSEAALQKTHLEINSEVTISLSTPCLSFTYHLNEKSCLRISYLRSTDENSCHYECQVAASFIAKLPSGEVEAWEERQTTIVVLWNYQSGFNYIEEPSVVCIREQDLHFSSY